MPRLVRLDREWHFLFLASASPIPIRQTKQQDLAGREEASSAPEKRGFFDRMKQAVTRTRDSFSESIGSVLALTREIDETSLTDLEGVLLAADIGADDGADGY